MNSGNNLNTVLLIIVLVLLVGGALWWYTNYGLPGQGNNPQQPAQQGLQVNLGSGNPQPQQ